MSRPLSPRDMAILAYLLRVGEAGAGEIRKAVGIEHNHFHTSMQRLRAKGTVIAQGRTRMETVYFIRPDLRAVALAQNLLPSAARPLLEAPA